MNEERNWQWKRHKALRFKNDNASERILEVLQNADEPMTLFKVLDVLKDGGGVPDSDNFLLAMHELMESNKVKLDMETDIIELVEA